MIRTTREGRVLRLTLNRPEKRNALSIEMCRDLVTELRRAEADESLGVILLDAAGPNFSSGMDLSEILDPEMARKADIHEELFTLGRNFSKPIVAAVQGAVFGGAVALVASAHITVAAQDVRFCCTEIHIGMWPYVAFRPIAEAIGERHAAELALTGRVVSAAEALDLGLVHRVVAGEQVSETATRLAAQMAAFDADALLQGLLFIQQTRGMDWEQAGLVARQFRDRAFKSAAFRKSVQEFLARQTRK